MSAARSAAEEGTPWRPRRTPARLVGGRRRTLTAGEDGDHAVRYHGGLARDQRDAAGRRGKRREARSSGRLGGGPPGAPAEGGRSRVVAGEHENRRRGRAGPSGTHGNHADRRRGRRGRRLRRLRGLGASASEVSPSGVSRAASPGAGGACASRLGGNHPEVHGTSGFAAHASGGVSRSATAARFSQQLWYAKVTQSPSQYTQTLHCGSCLHSQQQSSALPLMSSLPSFKTSPFKFKPSRPSHTETLRASPCGTAPSRPARTGAASAEASATRRRRADRRGRRAARRRARPRARRTPGASSSPTVGPTKSRLAPRAWRTRKSSRRAPRPPTAGLQLAGEGHFRERGGRGARASPSP